MGFFRIKAQGFQTCDQGFHVLLLRRVKGFLGQEVQGLLEPPHQGGVGP